MRLKGLLFIVTWSTMLTLQSVNSARVEWPVSAPTPTPWPEQFHARLFTSFTSGENQVVDFWYNWPNGPNVYLRRMQLGELMHDVEWKNGTSFYYTLGSNGSCEVIDFGTGLPRPDFLDGAHYLGTEVMDGFLCNGWEKLDFIWYYEDVATKRPVRWDFHHDGIITHVITFAVGATLPDSIVVQAPEYCFAAQKDVY